MWTADGRSADDVAIQERQPMTGVLSGVRVLDFGRYIAGPFAAAILGDLGADVLRVERVGGGEDRYIYPVCEAGDGALFLQMNRNKRGMTLDVKSADGQAVLRRLVARSDVVIANLPPETLREMGLSYEALCVARPEIIQAVVSGFGAEGPYAARVAFDSIGQAMSGAAALSGMPGQPAKSFASWVDFTTALLTVIGVLAALQERARSGRGQEVRTSLLDSALTVTGFLATEEALTGIGRTASGNRAQSGGPGDYIATRDSWIAVNVIGAPLFRRWARLIGEPEWLEDPRFATDALRAEHGAALSARTAVWARERTTAQALDALAAARIPAGPILSPREVLTDPHVQATGAFTPMSYPGLPIQAPIAMSGLQLSGTPVALSRRAPTLGEHIDEVLAELGYAPAEITALRAAGAV